MGVQKFFNVRLFPPYTLISKSLYWYMLRSSYLPIKTCRLIFFSHSSMSDVHQCYRTCRISLRKCLSCLLNIQLCFPSGVVFKKRERCLPVPHHSFKVFFEFIIWYSVLLALLAVNLHQKEKCLTLQAAAFLAQTQLLHFSLVHR